MNVSSRIYIRFYVVVKKGDEICHLWCNESDGIMIISVIVYMLTNYLGMPLIYLTAVCFFDELEGVYVNVKLRIL